MRARETRGIERRARETRRIREGLNEARARRYDEGSCALSHPRRGDDAASSLQEWPLARDRLGVTIDWKTQNGDVMYMCRSCRARLALHVAAPPWLSIARTSRSSSCTDLTSEEERRGAMRSDEER